MITDHKTQKMVKEFYNNGLIERKLHDGSKVFFGEELKGDDLIDAYEKNTYK